MKSTVLVRPNLKLFLVAALLIAVLHDLVFNGPPSASGSGLGYTMNVAQMSESDVANLVEIAEKRMEPDLYMRVSYVYEKRGEPRKALYYLRKAEKCHVDD